MIRAVTLFTLLLTSTAFSYEVGEKVVTIHEVYLDADGQMGDKLYPGVVFEIEVIEADRLWVGHCHPGWIESRHVANLDQGIQSLTKLIDDDPENALLYAGRALVWEVKRITTDLSPIAIPRSAWIANAFLPISIEAAPGLQRAKSTKPLLISTRRRNSMPRT